MSDANQTALYAVQETAWGETPNGSKTLVEIPTTGDSLAYSKVTADRSTIKPNRMGAKPRPVGVSAAGTTNHELTLKDYENLVGKGLLADSAPVAIDINAESCNISASGLTVTAAVGTPFTALVAAYPEFVRIAGAAQSGNNGVKKVASITSSVITLVAGLTTDETAIALDINANVYSNGADDVSFLLERQYSDTSLKQWFNGMIPVEGQFTIARRELVTLALTWMGKTSQFGINSATSGYLINGTPSAAATTIPVDTGTRALKKGQKFTIAGDSTIYSLSADFAGGGGNLTIASPGLIEAPADNSAITLAPDPQATAGDGSPTADAGTDALNSSSDVTAIYLDGAVVTECVDNLSFTIDNGHRERPCIGQLETAQLGKNRFRTSGSLTLQFEDLTEYQAFVDHDTKELSIGFQDPAGNFLGITLQAFVWTESPGAIPQGEDTDISLTLNFTGFQPESAPIRLVAIEFLDA